MHPRRYLTLHATTRSGHRRESDARYSSTANTVGAGLGKNRDELFARHTLDPRHLRFRVGQHLTLSHGVNNFHRQAQPGSQRAPHRCDRSDALAA
jgi:hypothetical protein